MRSLAQKETLPLGMAASQKLSMSVQNFEENLNLNLGAVRESFLHTKGL